MTKTELVKIVAKKTGTKSQEVEKILDCFHSEIIDAVASGETVKVTNFGVFTTSSRKARDTKNPRTGEDVHQLPCVTPRFKACKAFKGYVKAVNG